MNSLLLFIHVLSGYVSGVAELPTDSEYLRHRGVSRQAGGAGAPEHSSGGGDVVLEFRRFAFVTSRICVLHARCLRARSAGPGIEEVFAENFHQRVKDAKSFRRLPHRDAPVAGSAKTIIKTIIECKFLGGKSFKITFTLFFS